jgi:hypothetical protein
MGAADYQRSLPPPANRVPLDAARVPDSPWEPHLADTMRAQRAAAYEEALLPQLVADLRASAGEPAT